MTTKLYSLIGARVTTPNYYSRVMINIRFRASQKQALLSYTHPKGMLNEGLVKLPGLGDQTLERVLKFNLISQLG
jgi:hypothetical protein